MKRAGAAGPREEVRHPAVGRETSAGPSHALVSCCFFVSGFAGLVLEIVWSRSLALHVGGSAAGVTAVVTAYMAGLGLGSLLVSFRADRVARPLRLYALLEAAVGIFALASPVILRAPGPLYRLAHDLEEISWMIPFGVRFSISLILLLTPTTAMGATLPLLVSALSGSQEREVRESGGSRIALLYGINTLGAVLGAVAAGFLLLPRLGGMRTLWIAAACDLVIAAVLLSIPAARNRAGAGRARAAPPEGKTGRPDVNEASGAGVRRVGIAASRAEGAGGEIPPALRRLAMTFFGVSGGLSMVYELGWTRRLVTLLGSSVYSFTILLAVFLAGLGLGSLAVRRLAEKAGSSLAALGAGLALTGIAALAGTGLLTLVIVALPRVLAAEASSPGRVLAAEAALSAAVLLPAALLLGAVFPIAARVARAPGEEAGRASGRAYAVNTAGTVLGAAATGLFLLPAMGALAALETAAACHLTLGTVLLLSEGWSPRRLIAAGLLPAGFAGVWAAAPRPDAYRLNYGLVSMLREVRRGETSSAHFEELERGKVVHPARLLSVEEGRTATVAVRTVWDARSLVVNGKIDASNDDPTQVLLGQMPMILAGSSRRALVIGYGSGITTHSVLTHTVERVETVEIEPAIFRAGRYFAELNGQDAPDPRSAIFFEDGRTHLAFSRRLYDVIVSEPSNPWVAGVNNLFTEEFFELVRRRLAPGGTFCQWMHTYELSRESVGSILATLREVFPGAEVYRQDMDLLVIWNDAGAHPDRSRFEAAFADPAVRADLERVGFESPADLFALYLGPIEAVEAGAGERSNTDDNAFVEFRAPLDLLKGGEASAVPTPPLAALKLQRYDPTLPMAEVLRQLAAGALRRKDLARCGEIAAVLEPVDPGTSAGLKDEVLRLKAVLAAVPRARALEAESDQAFRNGDYHRCENLLRQALAVSPDDPDLLYQLGRAEIMLKNPSAAEEALRRSIDAHRRTLATGSRTSGSPYQAEISLGILFCRLSRFEEGLEHFARARRINPYQTVAYYYSARAFESLGRREEARKELAAGLAVDPFDELLRELKTRYRSGSTGAAGASGGRGESPG